MLMIMIPRSYIHGLVLLVHLRLGYSILPPTSVLFLLTVVFLFLIVYNVRGLAICSIKSPDWEDFNSLSSTEFPIPFEKFGTRCIGT